MTAIVPTQTRLVVGPTISAKLNSRSGGIVLAEADKRKIADEIGRNSQETVVLAYTLLDTQDRSTFIWLVMSSCGTESAMNIVCACMATEARKQAQDWAMRVVCSQMANEREMARMELDKAEAMRQEAKQARIEAERDREEAARLLTNAANMMETARTLMAEARSVRDADNEAERLAQKVSGIEDIITERDELKAQLAAIRSMFK